MTVGGGPDLSRSTLLAPGNRDGEDIVQILQQEHGYILSLLDQLHTEARKLAPAKVPDFPLLLEMIDYLLHFPDEYHHPREDLVYAGLRRNDPSFRPVYERLQQEHRVLHEHNERLYAVLTHIKQGRPADRQWLHSKLQDYVDCYRRHIQFESSEVFPWALDSLTPSQIKKISARTRFRNDPLFSKKIWLRYKRLDRAIRYRLGEIEERISFKKFSLQQTLLETISDLVDSYRDKPLLRRLLKPSLFSRGPSWQARVLNATSRRLIKPMMRFGSIQSMRSLIERMEGGDSNTQTGDVHWQPVAGKAYEGEWIRIRGKRPRKILLYFPGGAFVLRTPSAHRNMVSHFCRAGHCKALVVHYRLAPEIPFPGGLEDCLAAYHSLLEQGIKPENITIAGDSAGGGLVLSTLLALRDENTPMPANAILLSPLGDLTYSGESRQFNKHRDPMLPNHRASDMHELYIGGVLSEDRYVSPVLADFDGLPPMQGIVGSTEILLDDTVRAADKAKAANVPFHLEIWREMPHVFPLFRVLPETKVVTDRIGEFIRTGKVDPLPQKYGDSLVER